MAHAKIKELTNKYRVVPGQCINSKSGDILIENEEIQHRWNEYIEDLYKNKTEEGAIKCDGTEGHRILREEVAAALMKTMKRKKSCRAR